MNLPDLIRRHLDAGHMMQLATVAGDQPWSCTVYFVADEEFNLYWISVPERRHSHEIETHAKVSAAIPVQFSVGQPVIGVQVEGDAKLVTDQGDLEKGIALYDKRFKHDPDFYADFVAGRRQHKLYRLEPRLIVVFDEQNFTEKPRREWRPSSNEQNLA